MKVMILYKRTVYGFILAILTLKCQAFKYPRKAKFTVQDARLQEAVNACIRTVLTGPFSSQNLWTSPIVSRSHGTLALLI